MTIGIGVEGPSDRAFCYKVLADQFPKIEFDIRSMNNRDKLIRESPRLIDAFRSAHYTASFIVLDRNSSPCISSVLSEFDQQVRSEARKPLDERTVFICIAIRELEAWYLADEMAINKILDKSNYTAPMDTGTINAEKELQRLWMLHYSVALNKIDFAKRIATIFQPDSAVKHSASFSYFWNRISSQIPSP